MINIGKIISLMSFLLVYYKNSVHPIALWCWKYRPFHYCFSQFLLLLFSSFSYFFSAISTMPCANTHNSALTDFTLLNYFIHTVKKKYYTVLCLMSLLQWSWMIWIVYCMFSFLIFLHILSVTAIQSLLLCLFSKVFHFAFTFVESKDFHIYKTYVYLLVFLNWFLVIHWSMNIWSSMLCSFLNSCSLSSDLCSISSLILFFIAASYNFAITHNSNFSLQLLQPFVFTIFALVLLWHLPILLV